jgi:hypothetical protein
MLRPRIGVPGTILALAVLLSTVVGAGGHARAAASLVQGWNNVTYSGAASPPAQALSSISGTYAAVYRWNPTTQQYQVYAPGAPATVNTLSQLNPGDTIWLDVTAASASLTPSASAGTGHVSIAASTFQPASDLAIYEKTWNEIHPVGTDAESQRYFASVVLPNGATVTSLTAHYDAGSGATVEVRLDYTPLNNGTDAAQVYKLAEVLSTGGPSPQTSQAFAHTVDNSANVYFLIVDLKGGAGAKLRGVSVAYTGG